MKAITVRISDQDYSDWRIAAFKERMHFGDWIIGKIREALAPKQILTEAGKQLLASKKVQPGVEVSILDSADTAEAAKQKAAELVSKKRAKELEAAGKSFKEHYK